MKLGIPFEELGRILARYLKAIEFDDGYLESTQDLLTETLHHRKLSGEGEFDVKGFIEVTQDIGYGGPWGSKCSLQNCASCPWTRRAPERTTHDRPVPARISTRDLILTLWEPSSHFARSHR